jgi:alpha-tubulin suppressor-like RCC1 family protein
LYSWGNNSNGQLGIGSKVEVDTMQLVKFSSQLIDCFKVISISCGCKHALILSNDGMRQDKVILIIIIIIIIRY